LQAGALDHRLQRVQLSVIDDHRQRFTHTFDATQPTSRDFKIALHQRAESQGGGYFGSVTQGAAQPPLEFRATDALNQCAADTLADGEPEHFGGGSVDSANLTRLIDDDDAHRQRRKQFFEKFCIFGFSGAERPVAHGGGDRSRSRTHASGQGEENDDERGQGERGPAAPEASRQVS